MLRARIVDNCMQDKQRPLYATVSDAALAYALLRLALGTSMLVHGLVRMGGRFWPFVEHITKQFAPSPIPHSLVRISAMLIPPVELLIGALLILGLWTRFALVLGSIEMCALNRGCCSWRDHAGLFLCGAGGNPGAEKGIDNR